MRRRRIMFEGVKSLCTKMYVLIFGAPQILIYMEKVVDGLVDLRFGNGLNDGVIYLW